MSEYNQFFKAFKDDVVPTYCFGVQSSFEIENLYQAFKARLLEELRTQDNAKVSGAGTASAGLPG